MVIDNSHLSNGTEFLKGTSHKVYILYVYSPIYYFTQYSGKYWYIKNCEKYMKNYSLT